jgi:hypothetical protein
LCDRSSFSLGISGLGSRVVLLNFSGIKIIQLDGFGARNVLEYEKKG